ncbi:hypothetical protein BRC87_08825 [Halobacteriales archaeon QS_4_66_20]|nr:MAG: hypothetical protein BRC87_08825 [Halobacteriales archaeon QS_4_66_20]
MANVDRREALERGSATLLCEPPGAAVHPDCPEHLQAARGRYILGVTFGATPDEWFERIPVVPASAAGVVSAGGANRSTSTDVGMGAGVTVVDDPSDLVGLTVAVDRYLDRYEDVTVCFDSVTALLGHVSVERAYKFLNALTERLWRADADAHFHFRPAAHDPRTVQHVTSLFDDRLDAAGVSNPVER